MDIKVSLPNPNDITGKDIKQFIRQLELCVHHLEKSVEEMEKDGELNENTFILYRFPKIEIFNREQDGEGYIKVHIDEEGEFQNIEIEIANI